MRYSEKVLEIFKLAVVAIELGHLQMADQLVEAALEWDEAERVSAS